MLLHLSWRRNGDSFDLALAANRLAARGAPLWWLGAAGRAHEAGDYLVDAAPDDALHLARFGIAAVRWGERMPDEAVAIAYPRIALFAGHASGYPYFAYYALMLARLGFTFELVDGAALAGGALQRADLLVLPGGFSNWGSTRPRRSRAPTRRCASSSPKAARRSGPAAAPTISPRDGRPGRARRGVRPKHTHEYLATGVGIVSVRLENDSIGFGCPPSIEMPYYHGPIWEALDRAASVAGRFDGLTMPGHLFIANPLDGELFRAEMAGNAAILRADGRRGRAVLFSPHPEMGDLVRKYIAFDGYVAHYLPIRGEAVMAETLRHYRVLDAPSFRLGLNRDP